MAHLTPFIKGKLQHVFNSFYDINGDGVIDWDDFKEALQKICSNNKWDPAGPQAKGAEDTLKLVWAGLAKYADKNVDKKVTLDEWFLMWDEFITAAKNNKPFPDWQTKYCEFMFALNDTSGDGLIDIDEYTTAFTNFGLTKEQAQEAFNKFTNNGTVDLSLQKYTELWKEYFLSEDKNAVGNHIFGMLKC